MKNSTRYFLFILDELLVAGFIIAMFYFFDVSFFLLVISFIVLAIIFVFVSYIFLPQLKQPVTGSEGLIGMKAVALESFDQKGEVLVHGERWNAVNQGNPIHKGDKVEINEIKGLTLTVKKE